MTYFLHFFQTIPGVLIGTLPLAIHRLGGDSDYLIWFITIEAPNVNSELFSKCQVGLFPKSFILAKYSRRVAGRGRG